MARRKVFLPFNDLKKLFCVTFLLLVLFFILFFILLKFALYFSLISRRPSLRVKGTRDFKVYDPAGVIQEVENEVIEEPVWVRPYDLDTNMTWKYPQYSTQNNSNTLVVFNTYVGHLNITRVQCQYHPNAVFCTDSKLDIDCEQVISYRHYNYENMGYKKVQCLFMLRERILRDYTGVLLADVDIMVPDIFPDCDEEITCLRRVRWINSNFKTDSYYVFNELLPSPMEICLGAYIFIPLHHIKEMYENIHLFEHYHADDVAFSAFFDRLGFDYGNLPGVIKTPEHALDCFNPGHNLIIRTQCNPQEMGLIYSMYYEEKLALPQKLKQNFDH